MYLKEIVIGFDLGDTIVHGDSHGKKIFYPRALEVITRCCKQCKDVFIVSRVNEEQRLRALDLLETSKFHEITGMPKDHVFFCGARNQKGVIIRKLGINCFIDDRPEVMSFIDKSVYKILFASNPIEIQEFGQEHLPRVTGWTEIENIIFKEIT